MQFRPGLEGRNRCKMNRIGRCLWENGQQDSHRTVVTCIWPTRSIQFTGTLESGRAPGRRADVGNSCAKGANLGQRSPECNLNMHFNQIIYIYIYIYIYVHYVLLWGLVAWNRAFSGWSFQILPNSIGGRRGGFQGSILGCLPIPAAFGLGSAFRTGPNSGRVRWIFGSIRGWACSRHLALNWVGFCLTQHRQVMFASQRAFFLENRWIYPRGGFRWLIASALDPPLGSANFAPP